MTEDGMERATREWIEETLERLDMVEWDRFVVGEDPNAYGRYIEVYGWIDRPDEYKDFVLLTFYPDNEEQLYGFTTSSDRYTKEIYRRMFGSDADDHNDCQRVEYTFNVGNAIELGEQTTLTDGGRSIGTDNYHPNE